MVILRFWVQWRWLKASKMVEIHNRCLDIGRLYLWHILCMLVSEHFVIWRCLGRISDVGISWSTIPPVSPPSLAYTPLQPNAYNTIQTFTYSTYSAHIETTLHAVSPHLLRWAHVCVHMAPMSQNAYTMHFAYFTLHRCTVCIAHSGCITLMYIFPKKGSFQSIYLHFSTVYKWSVGS